MTSDPGALAVTVITVTGKYQAPDGTPAVGWVALSMMEPRQVHAEDPSFVTGARVTSEAVDGLVQFAVLASDDPQWSDGPRVYRVEEFWQRGHEPTMEWYCYLNGPGPVDLSTVARIDPVECGIVVPTQDHGAMTGLEDNDHPQYALVGHEHEGGDHTHDEYAPTDHTHSPAADTNWTWTDATSGDPGEGYLGADTALWQDATQIRISHIDGDGLDVPDLPEAVSPGDTLTLTNVDTREVGIYAIDAVTDQGTWFLLTVTYDRGGGGNPLPDAAMTIGITLQSAAPHNHDERYYTEAEAGSLFAATGHDHDADYAPTSHDHPSYELAGVAQGIMDTHEATNGLFFHGTMWRGTQAQFDALTPEATVLYLIVG